MYSFQYTVKTQARPEQAWEIYSNWQLWPRFANIYGRIIWSEGRPWEAGSRMRIELLKPIRNVVDHLIVACEPAKRLGWIDRCLGIAISQSVEFTPLHNGGTRIHTWGDLSAPDAIVGVKPAKELIGIFTETWYENYRIACDERHESLEMTG